MLDGYDGTSDTARVRFVCGCVGVGVGGGCVCVYVSVSVFLHLCR